MKILIAICFVLFSIAASSQPVISRGTTAVTVMDYRLFVKSNLFIPRYADTTTANTDLGVDSCAALIFTYDQMVMWIRKCSPKRWEQLGSGGGNTNSNIGSGYRVAVPSTNNVKTLFANGNFFIDSTTNTNALTFGTKDGFLNVRDFGASPSNSAAANATAFNAACSTSKAQGTATGVFPPVYVPAGDYAVNGIIRDPRVGFIGDDVYASILHSTTATTLLSWDKDTAFFGLALVRDIQFDGRNIGTIGFNTGPGLNFEFTNLIFKKFTQYAIKGKGLLIGTFRNIFIDSCVNGVYNVANLTAFVGTGGSYGLPDSYAPNLVEFNNVIIWHWTGWAVEWQSGEHVIFDNVDIEQGGTTDNWNTGGVLMAATNSLGSLHGMAVTFRNAWMERNHGVCFRQQYGNYPSRTVIDCSQFNAQLDDAPIMLVDGGGGAKQSFTIENSTLSGKFPSGTLTQALYLIGDTSTIEMDIYRSDIGPITKTAGIVVRNHDFQYQPVYALDTTDWKLLVINKYSGEQRKSNWQAAGSGLTNPMTTFGDIIYENVTPAAARLAGNTTTTKKFLTQTGNGSISAAPGWNTLVLGDIPDISTLYIQNQVPIVGAQTANFSITGTGDMGTITATTGKITSLAVGNGQFLAFSGTISPDATNYALYSESGVSSVLTILNAPGSAGTILFRINGTTKTTMSTAGNWAYVGKFNLYNNTAPTNGKLLIGHTANGTFELGNIASADGSITVTNNAGGIDIAVASATSGEFTPTLTNTTNVAASTAYLTQWIRVGDRIEVFGKVSIDPTSTGATELRMSLPITPGFGFDYEAGGTANAYTVAAESAAVSAVASSGVVAIKFIAVDVTNKVYHFNFGYKYIAP